MTITLNGSVPDASHKNRAQIIAKGTASASRTLAKAVEIQRRLVSDQRLSAVAGRNERSRVSLTPNFVPASLVTF